MEKRKYAVFNSCYNSLTFLEDEAIYKNNQKTGIRTYYYINLEGTDRVPWEDKKEKIKSIKFETKVKPVHIKDWFNNMKNLIHIIYLNKLDTSLITNMDNLFKDCKELTTLDLSSFNTSNVISMNNMFDGCNKLKTIKISKENFNIDNVEQSENMFKDCFVLKGEIKTEYNEENPKDKTLAVIDYEKNDTPGYFTNYLVPYASIEGTTLKFFKDVKNKYFNKQEREDEKVYYSNIENLGAAAPPWREKNNNITEIEINDVIKPSSTYSWFESINTDSIDISKINTIRLSNTSNMFKNCQNLISINTDENNYENVDKSSNMFLNCINLIGKEGTEYDSAFVDKTYARVDEGEDWPGYFSGAGTVKYIVYAVYDTSDKSLIFFKDKEGTYQDEEIIGTKTYYTNIEKKEILPWGDIETNSVHFETSVKLKTVRNLFNQTEEIINFENLDVSNITDMSYMFKQCKIENLDLSSLDTSSVTNMSNMFIGCQNLTELDLSNFDTSNVNNMSYMFAYCDHLVSLNINNFNTSNTNNMSGMFYNCYNLTTIINMRNMPENYDSMFYDAARDSGQITLKYFDPVTFEQVELLKTTENEGNVIISQGETAYAVYDSKNNKLTFFRDEEGKYYNGQIIETKTYYTGFEEDTQHIIPWVSKVGNIFEIEFEDNIKPKSTAFWFQSMINLEQIDNIEKLNTSEVEDMSLMFNDCKLLSTFDLSSFDTSNVTTMSGMFSGCSTLINLNLESLDMSKTKDVRGLLMGCKFVTTTINVTSIPENYAYMLYNAASNSGQITLKYFDPVTRDQLELLKATGSEDSNIVIESGEGVAYAVYDTTDYSLTFFRDEDGKYTDGQEIEDKIYYTGFEENEDTEYRPGWTRTNQIKSINGESKVIKPKITTGWFEGNDFENNDIDLQLFDLSNVINMEKMFMDCKGLKNVNLGQQNANNLEDAYDMFAYHQYDYSSEEPTNGLIFVNMENFNAPNLKNIENMFYGCKELESINMDWYESTPEDNPINVHGVFYGCEMLKTIGTKDFIIPTVLEEEGQGAVETFDFCYNLTATIEYGDLARGDGYGRLTYAARDSGLITLKCRSPLVESILRYDIYVNDGCNFCMYGEPQTEAYAKYNMLTKELTFFRDTRGQYNPEGEEIDNYIYYSQVEYSSINREINPVWHEYNEELTKIIFENKITPLSTENWFSGAVNLTSIEGLSNLNFKDALKTSGMFYNCYNLNEEINFNLYINNIRDEYAYSSADNFNMNYMFNGCEKLYGSINFSKADPYSESYYSEYYYDYMFENAALDAPILLNGNNTMTEEELINIANTKSKNSNVYVHEAPEPSTSQAYAYYDGRNQSLVFFRDAENRYENEESIGEKIYYTGFEENEDTEYTPNWYGYSIEKIEFKNEIHPLVTSNWFKDMNELTSINNINYLNTSNVTNMSNMFFECRNLTELNLSNFNTSNVTNMSNMFYHCENLTSLNLSSFDISNVTNIRSMFYECFNLESINFNIILGETITNVDLLFAYCHKIKTDLIISKPFEELGEYSYMLYRAADDENAEIELKYSGLLVTNEDINQFIEDYVEEGQHIINGGKYII